MTTSQPTLYLMMGLPGAGKTTVAQHIANLTSAVRLSSDDVRRELFATSTFSEDEHDELYTELDARVRAMLQQGTSVVYDANLNRREHRDEKHHLAASLGADTMLIWVKTPEEIAKQRRVQDQPQHDLVPAHETPAEMFDRIARVIQEPAADEPHVVIDGRHVTHADIQQALGR